MMTSLISIDLSPLSPSLTYPYTLPPSLFPLTSPVTYSPLSPLLTTLLPSLSTPLTPPRPPPITSSSHSSTVLCKSSTPMGVETTGRLVLIASSNSITHPFPQQQQQHDNSANVSVVIQSAIKYELSSSNGSVIVVLSIV